MQTSRFVQRFIGGSIAAALSLSLASMPVSATNEGLGDGNKDILSYWYAETYGGFNTANLSNTDNGSTLYDCMAKGNGSLQDVYTATENVINNAVDQTYNVVYGVRDATENVLHTVVDTTKTYAYETFKATNSFVDNAKTYWSVAGSGLWDNLYNSLFNNNGYNEQFTQNPNGSYQGVTTDGKSWSINGVSYGSYSVYDISPQTVFSTPLYQNCHENNNGWYGFLLDIDADGNHCFYYNATDNGYNSAVSNVHISNVSYGANNSSLIIRIIYTQWGHDRYEYLYFNLAGDGNISEGGTTVPLPYSVGVIRLGDGSLVPIYSDPSLNGDYTVQPDGTVTDSNGNEYPIYICPDDLSTDGQYQILNYIVCLPDNINNNYTNIFGYPVQNPIIKGTSDGINIELDLDGLGEIIEESVTNALSKFFKYDSDAMNQQISQIDYGDPLGLIPQFWHKVLEMFGVE